MFWTIYVSAWLLTLFFMQLSRRGVAGIRGEVRMSMIPIAYKIVLLAVDLAILAAAFSLLAAPFFVLSPWWLALSVFFGVFVLTSLVTGTLIAVMLRRLDLPELYARAGVWVGLAALCLTLGVWRLIGVDSGWFD